LIFTRQHLDLIKKKYFELYNPEFTPEETEDIKEQERFINQRYGLDTDFNSGKYVCDIARKWYNNLEKKILKKMISKDLRLVKYNVLALTGSSFNEKVPFANERKNMIDEFKKAIISIIDEVCV
jgi:hypothetical protein